MTKYHELFEILKDEVLSENGTYSLSAPENADVLRRAQECVSRIVKNEKEEKEVNREELEKPHAVSGIECYAFNVFGDVKRFENYKECSENIGIPCKNVGKAICQRYWVNKRWQIRNSHEGAELERIPRNNLLRFKKDGAEKILTNIEFSRETGLAPIKISRAMRFGKQLDGWSIERIAINTNKLIENGVAI